MSAEVLKEFLVTLGYNVDSSGQRNFSNGVLAVTAVVGRLGAAVAVTGEAITKFVLNQAKAYEDLYWLSKRTGESVGNINAFSYAVEQMGGSAEQARGMLTGLSQFLDANFAGQSILDMVVGSPEAGKTRNQQLYDLGRRLKELKDAGLQPVAMNFAQMLGLSYDDVLVLERSIDQFGGKYTEWLKKMGLDQDKTADDSHGFMNSLRDLGATAGGVGAEIADDLLPPFEALAGTLKLLITLLYAAEKAGVGFLDLLTGNWKQASTDFDKSISAFRSTLDVKELHEGPLAKGLGGVPSGKQVIDWFSRVLDKAPTDKQIVNWVSRSLDEAPTDKQIVNWVSRSLDEAPTDKQIISTGHAWVGQVSRWAQSLGSSGSGTLGIRNNNPTNLRSWGDTPTSGGFAHFSSAFDGISAAAGNLQAYARHGYDTIDKIISHWAPKADHNDTAGYIDFVSKRMGVRSDQKLNLSDVGTVSTLLDAIIRRENGRDPYSADLIAQAVTARLGGEGGRSGAKVALSQTNTTHVYGSSDPHATARDVIDEQKRVNGDLVRNLSGAVR